MDTYQKVIFLFFKKGFTVREIVKIMDTDLRAYRGFTYGGLPVIHSPMLMAQKILATEVSAHWQVKEYCRNEDIKEHQNRFHPQRPIEYKHKKIV